MTMADIDISLILGIVVSLAFSAFFSGMEIAFVSSNRLLAEVDKDKLGIARLPLSVFYRHPNGFVSTMLVGNNIVLVVYGILIAEFFDSTIFSGYDASFTVPADTILSTIIVLFTGEFLPKLLFKSSPNRMLAIFAFPAYICYIILWPISRFSTRQLMSHRSMSSALSPVSAGLPPFFRSVSSSSVTVIASNGP